MEPDEIQVSRWVDERLDALAPSAAWQPDARAALARLRRMEAPPRRRWWVWAGLSASAVAACAVLLVTVSIPSACANPLGCKQTAPGRVPTAVKPQTAVPAPHATPAAPPDFKQSGSSAAPVTCDLYSDFECPFCARFYLDTLPRVMAAYVDTGKVRLIERDDPLPRHAHARLAARYAIAAGMAGYYRPVAERLYRSEAAWSGDGDISSQVAQAIPPAAMEKVRALVEQDPSTGARISADLALARTNRVDRTPSLVCNQRLIAGPLTFEAIQAALDPLLARQP